MGHAPKLSQHERGQIDAPSTVSYTVKQIADVVKRSREKSSGRPSDLNGREKRTILHTASNSTTSIVGIRRTCGTDASESTKCSQVIQAYRDKMLLFARNSMRCDWGMSYFRSLEDETTNPSFQIQVIFGDGKKFSLVGPNGWHSYWSDLSRE
uniref:Auxin-responsive protein n=1 Tax=Heterorhabditis bacteriophora TaxID=37862 RepID=A0A1I7WRR1_HETBA